MSLYFTFPNSDWLAWDAGLDDQGIANAIDRYPVVVQDPEHWSSVIAAVDEDASAVGAISAAIWVPETHAPAVMGNMKLTSFDLGKHRGNPWKKALKAARRPPAIPNVNLIDYSFDSFEVDAGLGVLQHLATSTPSDDPVLHTYRFTIFPEDRNEVHILDFTTVYPLILDEFEEAITEVVNELQVEDSPTDD